MLSHKTKDFQEHNENMPSENVKKSVSNLEHPDTFEYKNLELSDFLNKKRQELELLNSRLASQNPSLYELVKQHEKEYGHSSSNSPFKENRSSVKDPEWHDRDVEREKRFKMREQERLKQNNQLFRQSDQNQHLKMKAPKEITPKKNQLPAHTNHPSGGQNAEGRGSTQNKQKEQERPIAQKKKHSVEQPVKSPIKRDLGRKSLVSQQAPKDLNKRQDNHKYKLDNKENQPVNVPSKHKKKGALRENQINISDIYEHHPIRKEPLQNKLETKESEKKVEQNMSPYPKNQMQHQTERKEHTDARKDNKNTSPNAQHPNENQFSEGNYDEQKPEIRQNDQMRSENREKNETQEHDFQNSANKPQQTENGAQFLGKLHEEDLRRSQLKSEKMRKYSEELRRQMEAHEEQKRKEQQKKKEEEAREAEKSQREVEKAVKRVEQSSVKKDNRNSPHSNESFEGPSPYKGDINSNKKTQKQESRFDETPVNAFDQALKKAWINIDNHSNLFHQDISSIEQPYEQRFSIPGKGQEKSLDLSQDKKQLAENLKEEKLRAENLALQEKLFHEQYKSKIKDIEMEKMMHMRKMQNIGTFMNHSMLPTQSNPLLDISNSPIIRKLSAHAQNFDPQMRLVASMPPQKFGQQTHHKTHFEIPNKSQDNDDDISIETDSLEQSMVEKSLPSTHYECQITKDQLDESYRKDLKEFEKFKQTPVKNTLNVFKPQTIKTVSYKKESEHQKQNHEEKLLYSINNMGLMITPAASEIKKTDKVDSALPVDSDKDTSKKSPESNEQMLLKDESSSSEDTEKEELSKGSGGLRQETARFSPNKGNILEQEPCPSKGAKEQKENQSKKSAHLGKNNENNLKHKAFNVKEELNKYETPFKEKDYFSKKFATTEAKKTSEEKGQEKLLLSGLGKESKQKLKDYLDLTTPQSTSSQRTSLSHKNYKSPKAIDPFAKRDGQESFSLRERALNEQAKEEMKALEWKKRVHDMLQNKVSKISSNARKDSDLEKKYHQHADEISLENTGDLKKAERMAREMEEEEMCIEEYERQINESSKKREFDHADYNGSHRNIHASHRKEISPPKNADDEDLEEIEASEQSEHPLQKGYQNIMKTKINNKNNTQRQSMKDWLGDKKSDSPQNEEVIEFETGNWEDLIWDLSQKGILDEEEGSKRTAHEKRSQAIIHKLEELLYDWTHDELDKENIDSNY